MIQRLRVAGDNSVSQVKIDVHHLFTYMRRTKLANNSKLA